MGRPRASLTFDDGPHPGTLDILETLARYSVRATFFQCGMYVRARPAITRQVLAAGHELGNHTDTHPWLWRGLPARNRREIERAQQAIEDAAGVSPRFFRPPYGSPGLGVSAAVRRLGMRSVLWTIIGKDWVLPADAIAARVLNRVHDGAILCLHDGRDINPEPDIRTTVEAVKQIVPAMIERGFVFETLAEAYGRTDAARH
jgi:peptidoglycan/xylan/chitin deacetylase (PgdA/CDA1 family)